MGTPEKRKLLPQNTCADTSAAENVSQAIGNTLQRSTLPLAEPTLFGQNTRSTPGQCAALRREVVRHLGKRDAGAITCDVTQGELRDTAPRMPGVQEPHLPLRPQEEKGRKAGPQNTCADTSAAENVSQAIGNTLQRSTLPLAEPTLFGQNTRSTPGQCAALRREVVRHLGKRDAGAITCDVTQGELRDTAPRMPGVQEPHLPLRP